MRTNKKIIAGVATGALVLGTAGVAYAYWTTTGTGSGTGATTAGVTETLTFSQDALSDMYPGDEAQPLVVEVENIGPDQDVYVTTIKAYITTDKDGCDGDDFLLSDGTADGSESSLASPVTLTWTAQDLAVDAADDATGTVQFNNKTGLDGVNQDVCKGATVTIHYLAS